MRPAQPKEDDMTYRNTLSAVAAFAPSAALAGGAGAHPTGTMTSAKMAPGAMTSDHAT
jgi:hypothetical protein